MKSSSAIGIALLSIFLALSFCAASPEEVAPNYTENTTALANMTNETTNATLVYVGSINAADLQNKTGNDLLQSILTRVYNTSDTANNASDVTNNSKSIPIYFVHG